RALILSACICVHLRLEFLASGPLPHPASPLGWVISGPAPRQNPGLSSAPRTWHAERTHARNIMPLLTEVDQLQVQVLADNVTDSLSSTPPFVTREWPALVRQ